MNTDIKAGVIGSPNAPLAQQPPWTDVGALERSVRELETRPPLVFAGECDTLKRRLATVSRGEAFILQGGDCAETFNAVSADRIKSQLETHLQMAAIMTYSSRVPIVKLGRIAGQYFKPRSSESETRGTVSLPTYRGDGVNSIEFTEAARASNPERLLQAYERSAQTINLIRAFTQGGYADLHQMHRWNREFVNSSPVGNKYKQLIREIDAALAFMRACGVDESELTRTEYFTSHEGLVLEYEEALTRIDSRTRLRYNTSAHLVWIGERTRQVNGGHLRYFATIENPISIKVGPTTTPDELRTYLETLDPMREPGRLAITTRMSADRVRNTLPGLLETACSHGYEHVVWICDPMHGNTFEAPSGVKTRSLDAIVEEVDGFFDSHRRVGTYPGGVHLEFTGANVTECVGGSDAIGFDGLDLNYETPCDPRLNRSQALDFAFLISDLHRANH